MQKSRQVVDSLGHLWTIMERSALPGSGEESPSLIAIPAARDKFRRFWKYPPNWRDLDEGALVALIEGPAQRMR